MRIPLAAGLGLAALAAGAAFSPIPLRGFAADPPPAVVVQQELPPSRPLQEPRDPKQIAAELDGQLEKFERRHGGAAGAAPASNQAANSRPGSNGTQSRPGSNSAQSSPSGNDASQSDLAQASSDTLQEIESEVNATNTLVYWGASIAKDAAESDDPILAARARRYLAAARGVPPPPMPDLPEPSKEQPPARTVAPAAGSGGSTTPAPAATACEPRPPVHVISRPDGADRIVVTVSSSTQPGSPANLLRELRFNPATNATVTAGDRSGPGGFSVTLSHGLTQATFSVSRVAPGAMTVLIVVVDGCGEWPSFVGSGGL